MQGQLFSQDFLRRGICDTPPWKAFDAAELSAFRSALQGIFEGLHADSALNEAQTEQLVIEPVLQALGWGSDYLPQVNLSGQRREDVPDILLFRDAQAMQAAVAEARDERHLRHGLALLEAKRWLRALDRSDDSEASDPGAPSSQMLRYLSRADVVSDRAIKWGRRTDGEPAFVEVAAPTDQDLQALLHKIIARLMKLLTRRGVLVEEEGSSYLADGDADSDDARTLRPLQAAPGQWPGPSPGTDSPLDCLCPGSAYRIAFGPRAEQKVFTVQGTMPRDTTLTQALCADEQGFSLHAAVRCAADARQQLEQLCRYITRPALANERVQCNGAGQVVLKLKTSWRDGTTHIVMSPLEFMQRLAALVPRPRRPSSTPNPQFRPI